MFFVVAFWNAEIFSWFALVDNNLERPVAFLYQLPQALSELSPGFAPWDEDCAAFRFYQMIQIIILNRS
jgi:hypothetical protein